MPPERRRSRRRLVCRVPPCVAKATSVPFLSIYSIPVAFSAHRANGPTASAPPSAAAAAKDLAGPTNAS